MSAAVVLWEGNGSRKPAPDGLAWYRVVLRESDYVDGEPEIAVEHRLADALGALGWITLAARDRNPSARHLRGLILADAFVALVKELRVPLPVVTADLRRCERCEMPVHASEGALCETCAGRDGAVWPSVGDLVRERGDAVSRATPYLMRVTGFEVRTAAGVRQRAGVPSPRVPAKVFLEVVGAGEVTPWGQPDGECYPGQFWALHERVEGGEK